MSILNFCLHFTGADQTPLTVRVARLSVQYSKISLHWRSWISGAWGFKRFQLVWCWDFFVSLLHNYVSGSARKKILSPWMQLSPCWLERIFNFATKVPFKWKGASNMKVNFYYTTLHSRDSCLTWAGTTNLRIMIGEIYCFGFAMRTGHCPK